MININNIYKNTDIKILLIVSSLLQIAYLLSIPLGFECDAAMFYAYAKGLVNIDGGVISSYRPFMYPIFLLLTGSIIPGTFLVTILFQAIFGILTPIITYKILITYGRIYALLGSILIIISCVSYVGAKLILAEQLYLFILINSIFFLAKYLNESKIEYLYIYITLTLFATLTRLEGQIPSACGITLILCACYLKTRNIKLVIVGLLYAMTILTTYSYVRSVYLRDISQFGSLQTGTGAQFYNRFYGGFGAKEFNEKRNIGNSDNLNQKGDSNLIKLENGPATNSLRKYLGIAIVKYPEIYQGMEDGLSKLIKEKDAPADTYYELFGRFEGNSEELLNNIFNSERNLRTIQYSFYVPEALAKLLGRKKADQILLNASFEAIYSNPYVLYSIIPQAVTLLGFNILPFYEINKLNSFEKMKSIVFWPGIFDYARTGFNAGNCAMDILPKKMWIEYENDYILTNSKFSELMINSATTGRNFVRFTCGLIVILLSPLVFFRKNRIFNLFLLSSILLLVVTIGLSVSGGGSKYDIAFMPLLVILAISLTSNLFNYIKLRRLKNER